MIEMTCQQNALKSGKVDPIPVETRDLKEATKTLDDLREGNITGRVVLEP